MSTTTIRPVVDVTPNGKEAELRKAGFTSADVASYMRKLEYRKRYNERSDVKAKRAEYMKARYERMKLLGQILSSR